MKRFAKMSLVAAVSITAHGCAHGHVRIEPDGPRYDLRDTTKRPPRYSDRDNKVSKKYKHKLRGRK